MQEQGKRLLLAVALALGVLMLWNRFFGPKPDQQPAQGSGTGTASGAALAVPTERPTTQVGFAKVQPPVGKEERITLRFPAFAATFSNHGGVLASWQLTDARYQHDDTRGELLDTRGSARNGAFELGFRKGSTFLMPEHQEWTGKQLTDHSVEYTYSSPELELIKTYDIDPEAYLVRVKIAVKTKTADAHQMMVLSAFERQDPKKAEGGSGRIQARAWQSSTLKEGTMVSTDVPSLIKDGPREETNIQWTGFEHPYLLVGFAPQPTSCGAVTKDTFFDTGDSLRTDLLFQPGVVACDVVGYLGPKNLDQLDHADGAAGFPTGFNSVIDLGWFGFIGRPLLWLLLKFHELLGNWGIAIMLLTVLVKGATLYWTTKSMRSMKAMAALGPQAKALQEKYKDDKQRANLETMALYKQHNVSMVAGCLPILLQMPIWLALYRMLSSAGELYQQPFIGGWIDDLTAADPYYVLPVVLLVTMFGQARLNPQTMDPSQRLQQRMMQYGMPLLFGGMSLFFPSGLTLYIFTNTCLSALHSIYMNKYDKKSIELTALLKKNQAEVAAAKDAAKVAEAKAKAEPAPEAGKPRPNRPAQKKKKGGRR